VSVTPYGVRSQERRDDGHQVIQLMQ